MCSMTNYLHSPRSVSMEKNSNSSGGGGEGGERNIMYEVELLHSQSSWLVGFWSACKERTEDSFWNAPSDLQLRLTMDRRVIL